MVECPRRGRILSQLCREQSVTYDEDSPGLIRRAAKDWLDADKHVRPNLFYPDKIEKYISRGKSEGAMPDAKDFVPPEVQRPKSKVQVSGRGKPGTLDMGHGRFPTFRRRTCLSFCQQRRTSTAGVGA
ncbi:MAG: hypothetical protein IPK98_11110 [Chloracidobacterium sp.]|nr:hypothetical protein [Chloracidobacterium sp.]